MNPRVTTSGTWPACVGIGGRFALDQVADIVWIRWPNSLEYAVPPSYVYTRFLRSLYACQSMIDEMFNNLVTELGELLPDFGNILAIDGKAIESHGNPRSKTSGSSCDGRRDVDATWGVKTYKGKRDDGTIWSTKKRPGSAIGFI